MCKDKKVWGGSVTKEIRSVWMTFQDYLRELRIVRVKRFCFLEPNVRATSIDMHRFCDSSKHICSPVVYLRIKTTAGVRVSAILDGWEVKTVPLESRTILHLELLGCALLNKLISEMYSAVSSRLLIDSIFCWADSGVTLCWIMGKETSYKSWVETRTLRARKV